LYFGLLLGVGFRTRMATPLWYAIPLAAAAGGIAAALAVGLGAGLGRSWPVARAVADSRASPRPAAAGRAAAGSAAAGRGDAAVQAGLRIATRRRSDVGRAVAAVVIMGAALASSHL
jgi:hypothetical protein